MRATHQSVTVLKINLIMSGNKRKKSITGVAIEDDLPDHLHYHGNAPKQNEEFPGIFSTPVIPFISRHWNYNHWIYRTDEFENDLFIPSGIKNFGARSFFEGI
jgi:hypothetical protein